MLPFHCYLSDFNQILRTEAYEDALDKNAETGSVFIGNHHTKTAKIKGD